MLVDYGLPNLTMKSLWVLNVHVGTLWAFT